MLDWIARIIFWTMGFISGDLQYFIISLMWEIWVELIAIKKKL